LFSPIVDENKIVLVWFNLPMNFTENPDALLRKDQSHTVSSFATPLTNEPVTPTPSAPAAMAQKSLHEYSVLAIANMPIGPTINTGNGNFELKTG
jgi:hypothetical protein